MADSVSVYPKTYQYGPVAKIGFSLLSLLFLLPGFGGAGVFMVAAVRPDWLSFLKLNFSEAGFILGPMCLGFGVMGLLALIGSLRGKLVLYTDRLEYVGVFVKRIVRHDEIVETRNIRKKYTQLYLTLVLKGRRNVTISDFGKADEDLFQWFGDIPNAEARAEEERNQALLSNPAFGTSEEGREKAINRQISILNVLGYAAQGAGLWGMIYPHPYEICIAVLAAIPVLAVLMVLVSGGRWSLTGDPKWGRISLTGLVVLPIAGLSLRAMLDNDLIDWQGPLMYAAAATPLFMAAVAAIEQRFSKRLAVLAAFLYFAYAWADFVHINNLLDNAKPSHYPVQVLDMRISSGRSTSYYLTLPPWGPFPKEDEYSVGSGIYHRVHKGDTVCVYLFPGALGWRNYDFDDCPAPSGKSTP